MAEPDENTPAEGGSQPPAEGQGEPTQPDPLDQKLSALKTELAQTFTDRLAAIEARLTAPTSQPAQTPAPQPQWYDTPEGIEAAYEAGQIKDTQRIQAHARLQAAEMIRQGQVVQSHTQRQQAASAEWAAYVALEPALSKTDSDLVQQIWQAIHRMAGRGLGEFIDGKPTLATQVQAVEMILGPIEALRAKKAVNDYGSGRRPTGGLGGAGLGSEPSGGGKPTDPWDRLTSEGQQFYLKSGYTPEQTRSFLGKHTDDTWWTRAVADGRAKR